MFLQLTQQEKAGAQRARFQGYAGSCKRVTVQTLVRPATLEQDSWLLDLIGSGICRLQDRILSRQKNPSLSFSPPLT